MRPARTGSGSAVRERHDGIWPILERYTDHVEDPSLRSPDVRAAWVFFFTGVGLGR